MAAVYISKKGEVKISLFCNDPRTPRRDRGQCGVRTRRGTSCKAPPVWDKEEDKARNGRCKLHGGLSTGPKNRGGQGGHSHQQSET